MKPDPTRSVDAEISSEGPKAPQARPKNAGMFSSLALEAPQVGAKSAGPEGLDGNPLHVTALPLKPTRSVDAQFCHETPEAPQAGAETGLPGTMSPTKPIPPGRLSLEAPQVDAHFSTLGVPTGPARSARRKIPLRTLREVRRVLWLVGGDQKGWVRRFEVEGHAVQWPHKITKGSASGKSLRQPSATRWGWGEASQPGTGQGRPWWKLHAGVLQQRRFRPTTAPRKLRTHSNPEFSRPPAALPLMKAKNPRRPAVLSAGSRLLEGVATGSWTRVFARACGAFPGAGPHLEISASRGQWPRGALGGGSPC